MSFACICHQADVLASKQSHISRFSQFCMATGHMWRLLIKIKYNVKYSSSVVLTKFLARPGFRWLVATGLNSTALDHSHAWESSLGEPWSSR